jgi:hypothetical protein
MRRIWRRAKGAEDAHEAARTAACPCDVTWLSGALGPAAFAREQEERKRGVAI